MIENALTESSAMEKNSLESCMLHKIMAESPTMEQTITAETKGESPSMEKAIPEDLTRDKMMPESPIMEESMTESL